MFFGSFCLAFSLMTFCLLLWVRQSLIGSTWEVWSDPSLIIFLIWCLAKVRSEQWISSWIDTLCTPFDYSCIYKFISICICNNVPLTENCCGICSWICESLVWVFAALLRAHLLHSENTETSNSPCCVQSIIWKEFLNLKWTFAKVKLVIPVR